LIAGWVIEILWIRANLKEFQRRESIFRKISLTGGPLSSLDCGVGYRNSVDQGQFKRISEKGIDFQVGSYYNSGKET
jgi:hypothetical protein